MTAPQHSRKTSEKKTVLLFALLLLLLCVAALFLFGGPAKKKTIGTGTAIPPDQPGTTANVPAPETPAGDFRPTAEPQQPATQQPRPESQVPSVSAPPATAPEQKEKNRCVEAGKAIAGMYAYLDQQDYVHEYRLPAGTARALPALFAKLLADAPETPLGQNDPLGRAKAMVHLFRVLGPTDIGLLLSLLAKESARIEYDLDNLYTFYLEQPPCPDPTFAVNPEKAYEYAVFFLATPGGNAYLARRDRRLNLLARYYCLRIIDLANELAINRYGIDIMKYAPLLRTEIDQDASLRFRSEYLRFLDALSARFESPSGRS